MLANARMLTRYNAWSNRLMYDAVAALPAGEAVKERKSLFKNMVHTLNHNYVIDAIWRAHLEGHEHGYAARNTVDYPPLAELREKQQAMDRWFITWGEAQTEASLGEKMSFTLIGGNAGTMTRFEILQHVSLTPAITEVLCARCSSKCRRGRRPWTCRYFCAKCRRHNCCRPATVLIS